MCLRGSRRRVGPGILPRATRRPPGPRLVRPGPRQPAHRSRSPGPRYHSGAGSTREGRPNTAVIRGSLGRSRSRGRPLGVELDDVLEIGGPLRRASRENAIRGSLPPPELHGEERPRIGPRQTDPAVAILGADVVRRIFPDVEERRLREQAVRDVRGARFGKDILRAIAIEVGEAETRVERVHHHEAHAAWGTRRKAARERGAASNGRSRRSALR